MKKKQDLQKWFFATRGCITLEAAGVAFNREIISHPAVLLCYGRTSEEDGTGPETNNWRGRVTPCFLFCCIGCFFLTEERPITASRLSIQKEGLITVLIWNLYKHVFYWRRPSLCFLLIAANSALRESYCQQDHWSKQIWWSERRINIKIIWSLIFETSRAIFCREWLPSGTVKSAVLLFRR